MGLLNSIATHEGNSGVSLKAWAEKTPDPDLKACLSLVAARETSHYYIFKRRIEELGYTLLGEEESDSKERLRVRSSDLSDIEKIRWQSARQQPPLLERWETAVSDEGIDPLTQSLLRWFLAEEVDSSRLLGEAYACVEARAS